MVLICSIFLINQCRFSTRENDTGITNKEGAKDSLIVKETGKLDSNGNRTGKWTGYFSGNKIGYLGYYENGLKDSAWIFYNPLGLIVKKEHYSKGLKNGITSIYSEGILYDEVEFKNDKKNGRHSHYSSPKQLNYYQEYKDGYFDGEYVLFFEDGSIKQKGKFVHGRCVGEWLIFYSNGAIMEKTVYASFSAKYREIKYNQDGFVISDETK